MVQDVDGRELADKSGSEEGGEGLGGGEGEESWFGGWSCGVRDVEVKEMGGWFGEGKGRCGLTEGKAQVWWAGGRKGERRGFCPWRKLRWT